MGYNAHDVLRKVVTYYTRKHKNFKNQLWLWFEIDISFKEETLNLQGIITLPRIHIYSKIMNKKNMSRTWTIISIYYKNL